MIARIEMTNTLAPVRAYGKHQGAKTKGLESGKSKNRKDSEPDDRYYDLDDDFIDDADIPEDELGDPE